MSFHPRLPLPVLFLVVVLTAVIGTPRTAACKSNSPWQGTWRTSFSDLTLKQDGTKVKGTYGSQGQFRLEGTVEGNRLTFEYVEGAYTGNGTWTLAEGEHSFVGSIVLKNGRSRTWNGWRPDPKALSGSSEYEGMWLTSLGLMDLKKSTSDKGASEFEGVFGWRGRSSIRGNVQGRRFAFDFNVFRPGSGWFEMREDGQSFSGAARDKGAHGWWAWKGRAAPEYVLHVPLKAGTLVYGATQSMLSYVVRAPDAYKPGESRTWPCILLFHGMNMNAEAYVHTFASTWKDLARRYIVLGINGERPSRLGTSPRAMNGGEKRVAPAFNYTYVNWVGRSTHRGFPNTHRESPALVGEAMQELKARYPIEKYFVGGHSQGAFLTYVMLMNFPDQIAGAFPIAGGVIVQAEPAKYVDEALRREQRQTPLAIVHSKSDPNVSFQSTESAFEMFSEASWGALKLMAPQRGGHMFARLPVGEAVRWLDVMTTDDIEAVHRFAETKLKSKDWADVETATAHAARLESSPSERTRALWKALDDVANEDATRYEGLLRAALAEETDASGWIGPFLTFRDTFRRVPCAKQAMEFFQQLRERHREVGDEIYREAREAFRQGHREEGKAAYGRFLHTAWAHPKYRTIKRWVRELK